MQINSYSSYTPQTSPSQGVDNQTQINDQRDRLRVQEESTKKNQSQNEAKQSRFDVDQQSLALVQEQSVDRNNSSNKNYSQSSSQQAAYDQPSQRNQIAVAAYESVDNIAQRDDIQQVFGIDLLA